MFRSSMTNREKHWFLRPPESRRLLENAKVNKSEQAKLVGKLIAEKALEKGINEVIFDRNGYLYHGRVKSLADAARENGLKF